MNINAAIYFIIHYFTAKRKGHGVHSPFAYTLCEEVFYNENSFYDFHMLTKLRENLLRNEHILTVEDYGAGSKTMKGKQRKVKDIASTGISSRKQSELLYKLSNFLKCQTSIELGTSLGLNTLYLALVNKQARVISIEGSVELNEFAKDLAKKIKIINVDYIQGNFDTKFQEVLNSTTQLDLLYIDGNHTYEATLRYFTMALEKRNNNSVFIFDDIYWSHGMTKAWQEIKSNPAVTLSIDTFHFGLVFFRAEIKEKRNLKFFL